MHSHAMTSCATAQCIRVLARKEKKSAFCMNWEENTTGGLGGTVSPSVGSVWDRGGGGAIRGKNSEEEEKKLEEKIKINTFFMYV